MKKSVFAIIIILTFLGLIMALWLGFFWKAFCTFILVIWCLKSISNLDDKNLW